MAIEKTAMALQGFGSWSSASLGGVSLNFSIALATAAQDTMAKGMIAAASRGGALIALLSTVSFSHILLSVFPYAFGAS